MYKIMNTINSLKKHTSNIFSTLLVIGLFAGCASVTDANLDSAENSIDFPTIENSDILDHSIDSDDSIWFNTNGDDMDPIIERPRTGDQRF